MEAFIHYGAALRAPRGAPLGSHCSLLSLHPCSQKGCGSLSGQLPSDCVNLITFNKVAVRLVCDFIFFTRKRSYLYILANILLLVGTQHRCTDMFLGKEDGIQVLAGRTPSSQTVESLLRTPWLAKPARK
jgi:hypothetical protein